MLFVKICGITSEADGLLAVAVGANAVGFVFAPSKRQVTAKVAGEIANRLPSEILTVGVFRDEAPKRVAKIVQEAGLRAAQLHGTETPDQVREVRDRGVNIVLKSVPAGSPQMETADSYGADAILVDGITPGSGKVYNWALTDNAPMNVKLILAGGLSPDNVAAAIERTRPWGVDVSSGVEREPGEKDATLMRDFVSNARSAYGQLTSQAGSRPVGEYPYDWQEDATWR